MTYLETYLKECKKMEYSIENHFNVLAEGTWFNYKFYVVSYGTHPCCYVEIPMTHKLYGKNYNDDEFEYINVHGGITYAQYGLHGIFHKDWIIGWDYAHIGDYNGIYDKDIPELNRDSHKWTTKEMLEDVYKVCKQLREMEN